MIIKIVKIYIINNYIIEKNRLIKNEDRKN